MAPYRSSIVIQVSGHLSSQTDLKRRFLHPFIFCLLYLQLVLKLSLPWCLAVSKQAGCVPVWATQPTSGQVHLLEQQEGTAFPVSPPLTQSSFGVPLRQNFYSISF